MLDQFLGSGTTGVKIPFIDLWSRKLIDHLHRYKSTYGKPQTDSLYYSPEFLYSEADKICALYIIDAYPDMIPIDLESIVRNSVTGFSTKVTFLHKFSPYSIDWNSAKTHSTINNWHTSDSDVEDKENDAYKYHDNYVQLSNKNRHNVSLFYFTEAQSRGVTLFKTRIMFTVTGTRGSAFDDDLHAVEEVFKSLNIKITRIEDSIADYASYFSPSSLELPKLAQKNTGYSVFTDEILSRLSNYRQGQTSGVGLVNWGIDVYSGYSVFSDFKRKPTDADNVLVVAETGGGKSFLVKNLLLYLLADDRFILSINDIEGGEYDHLADFIKNDNDLPTHNGIHLDKTVFLDLSEGAGRYYDPMELHKSGDEDLDKGAFSTAVMYAKGILTLMTGSQTGDTGTWISNILDDAIGKAYADRGVTEDINTWDNSKGMKLQDVYDEIKTLYKEDDVEYRDNKKYQNARDLVKTSLAKYFEGIRKNYFQHPITLQEIVDAKIVICSFGLRSKVNPDEIQVGLAQLYASAISHIRSVYAKVHSVYNVKVWEEFQRWGALKGSEPIIRTALTGGRKMGDVNIIITNSISPILDNDKFGIFESTTSYAISKINSTKTRHELAKTLGISRMISDLDAIAGVDSDEDNTLEGVNSVSDDRDIDELYNHAFLVKTSTDTVISKVYLPRDIANSPLFYTAGGAGKNPSSIKEDENSNYDLTGLLNRAGEVLDG